MENVYVYDAVRTPRGKGKKRGGLAHLHPQQIAAETLKALQKRNNLEPEKVDDVILGCVTQVDEQAGCIARYAVMSADWPESVPGYTVNRFCGSGLQAINNAVGMVGSGQSDLIVAGGVESMSRVKMGADMGDLDMSIGNPYIAEKYNLVPQGISADLIATIHGFSREQVDAFAARSQRKADEAIKAGYFKNSITPVPGKDGGVVELDEHPLNKNDMESFLAGLPAVFKTYGEKHADAIALKTYPDVKEINHVHTLGNSSGVVDGAGTVLLGSEKAKEWGLKPRARIVSVASVGSEPTIMLTGPVPAVRKALDKAGLTADDIDLFEINEAFAAVVLFVQKELGIPDEKINVNGGAIALGHPLGGTGAILLGTVVDELERRNARYGCVTLCIGGGMGIATIVERV